MHNHASHADFHSVTVAATAVGRQPLTFGKPNINLWRGIQETYPSIEASKCVMFGDNMETDIAFANNSSFRYSVLVETGIHKEADVRAAASDSNRRHLIPTHLLPSLSCLSRYL